MLLRQLLLQPCHWHRHLEEARVVPFLEKTQLERAWPLLNFCCSAWVTNRTRVYGGCQNMKNHHLWDKPERKESLTSKDPNSRGACHLNIAQQRSWAAGKWQQNRRRGEKQTATSFSLSRSFGESAVQEAPRLWSERSVLILGFEIWQRLLQNVNTQLSPQPCIACLEGAAALQQMNDPNQDLLANTIIWGWKAHQINTLLSDKPLLLL